MLRLLRVPFIPQSHFSDTEASEHAYKWGWFHTFFRQSYEKGNGLPMGGLSERKSMALASEINMCSAAGHSREDIIPSLLILRHRTSSATWETQNCSFFFPPSFHCISFGGRIHLRLQPKLGTAAASLICHKGTMSTKNMSDVSKIGRYISNVGSNRYQWRKCLIDCSLTMGTLKQTVIIVAFVGDFEVDKMDWSDFYRQGSWRS